eukprot:TRINITY_DN8596_c0_g1_i2.p3 TRINITY_DN8596_c0_g1~~TRINITY_DN8596_c0_g1_i2.p3  ORF type:complete len:124 (-),score=47.98 TRINITY_DN8596_c0_g1_i2:17-388(-)
MLDGSLEETESAKTLLQKSRIEALEHEILSSYRQKEAGIVRNIDALLSAESKKRVSTSDEAKAAFLEDLRRRNEELEEQASKRRKDIESTHVLCVDTPMYLSLIHICRCRRIERCRSRWSPYH